MRINLFVAKSSGLSRRQADVAIEAGQVTVNGTVAQLGQAVTSADSVRLNQTALHLQTHQTIMLYKPVGYVCSRRKQGSSPTIYDLLPEHHQLKPVGRLDKNTSGLLLLTNNGVLAHKLTHPSKQKRKYYKVWLKRPLSDADIMKIERGVRLPDGPSRLSVAKESEYYQVVLAEGRNRQIRRTFAALGNQVTRLHRYQLGGLQLGNLKLGGWRPVRPEELA